MEYCCGVKVSKCDTAIAKLSPEFTNEELDLFKKLVQFAVFVLIYSLILWVLKSLLFVVQYCVFLIANYK